MPVRQHKGCLSELCSLMLLNWKDIRTYSGYEQVKRYGGDDNRQIYKHKVLYLLKVRIT